MELTDTDNDRPRIVPALRQIQERCGYLDPDELRRFSREAKIPLYKIQAVASFFPHFHLKQPPPVTISVCRDMACHMAGLGGIYKELRKLSSDKVKVEGVSCLGRCDRAPAARVTVQNPAEPSGEAAKAGGEKEFYFLGRSALELQQIVRTFAERRGAAPKIDLDARLPGETSASRYPSSDWKIDPYAGRECDFAVVKKVVAARNASIRNLANEAKQKMNLTEAQAEIFWLVETGALEVPLDKQMLDGVREMKLANNWADAFLAEMDEAHADLRGLGGAGIPATQKWRDVRDAVRNTMRRRMDSRAFVVVNGDESEPGTFKDRELLLHYPHLIVEAVIVAALITEATEGFIYIRHEYPEQIAACKNAIRRAEALGMCGQRAPGLGRPLPVSVFTSPGGYICGEQSALIEAMSDHRGEPRNMPPKLETNGLDDQPTLVSNVETYAWVPFILTHGGKAYAEMGVNACKGRRFFSVSGDVVRPGVYEVPMGLTLRELILGKDYCRGIAGGKKLKAIAPSGPSGGFLPAVLTAETALPRDLQNNKTWQALAKRRGFDPAAKQLDVLDLELELNIFRALSPTQMLGAGLVVYAEGRDMAEQAVNAIQFFRNESCGKCVPCRIGSQKLATLGTRLMEKRFDGPAWKELMPMVRELTDTISLASICGLGRSVPIPLRTMLDFFNDDVNKHLDAQKRAAKADGPRVVTEASS